MDKKATWDRFYKESASKGEFKNFEWFFGFHSVKNVILPMVQSMSLSHESALHILDMGCGTSALGPCIYSTSPCAVRVTCADISPEAVKLMKVHTSTQPSNKNSSLEFLELDGTELSGHFGARTLDMILDKGTTDALVRSKEGRAKAGQLIRQCVQILKPSGRLLQFSDEDPDARLIWLENEVKGVEEGADVGYQEMGEQRGVSYFCYQISPRTASDSDKGKLV
ncbi:hypothetical protein DNTS_013608 [Danionella cerebrum]|uniref:Citrate synthase-lysine N-methyltransferase CSKMT, mitochondrial n=1 Tax=Danionella cerebrum TaxID=2873325 RepID=A0A553QCJ1_9TELE|nr:hypothetical protein DNTS_013608 [Danionella translucida]